MAKSDFWRSQIIKDFLHKKIDAKIVNNKDEKKTYYFKIPYVGQASDNFKIKLCKLFRDANVKIQVVFTSTKVSSYFSLKDRTNYYLKSCLAYEFTCLSDSNNTYVGKTKRFYGKRLGEHGVKGTTSVSKHLKKCEMCFNCDNLNNCFEILSTANSDFDIKIIEALLIKKKQPIINKQMNFSGVEFTLKIFWFILSNLF